MPRPVLGDGYRTAFTKVQCLRIFCAPAIVRPLASIQALDGLWTRRDDYGDVASLSTKHTEPGIFNSLEVTGISMPLTPGHITGYDNERMVFRFSMFCGDELVECQISAAAIDELVGGPRGSYVDRQTQFAQLRQTIERLASAKFEAGTLVRGTTLRIFAKDIPKATPQNDFTTSGKSPSRSA